MMRLRPVLVSLLAVALVASVLTSPAASQQDGSRLATTEASGASAAPAATDRAGYWMLDDDGEVYAFGDAVDHGDGTGLGVDGFAGLIPRPSGDGYWILTRDGALIERGDAPDVGTPFNERSGSSPFSAGAATATGQGVWAFTEDGQVIALGDAVHHGDLTAININGTIVDAAITPSGNGYWMLGSEGGIFAFGDAPFLGSIQGVVDDLGLGIPAEQWLNAPIVGLVPSPDGDGYWLVASDGGIFAFGNAPFRGSVPAVVNGPLARPVNGMVAYGNGYLMVASDGGVFTFSDLAFLGSLGANPPPKPVVGITPLPQRQTIAVSGVSVVGMDEVAGTNSLQSYVELAPNGYGAVGVELHRSDGDRDAPPDVFVVVFEDGSQMSTRLDENGATITVDGEDTRIDIGPDNTFTATGPTGDTFTGNTDDYEIVDSDAASARTAASPGPGQYTDRFLTPVAVRGVVRGPNSNLDGEAFVTRIKPNDWRFADKTLTCEPDYVATSPSFNCRVAGVRATPQQRVVDVEHILGVDISSAPTTQLPGCEDLFTRLRAGVRPTLGATAAMIVIVASAPVSLPAGLVLLPAGAVAISAVLRELVDLAAGDETSFTRDCFRVDLDAAVTDALRQVQTSAPGWELTLSIEGRNGVAVAADQRNTQPRFGSSTGADPLTALDLGTDHLVRIGMYPPLDVDLDTESIARSFPAGSPIEMELFFSGGAFSGSTDPRYSLTPLTDGEVTGLNRSVSYTGLLRVEPWFVEFDPSTVSGCRDEKSVGLRVADGVGNTRTDSATVVITQEQGDNRQCPLPFSVDRDPSPSNPVLDSSGRAQVLLPFTVFGGYDGSVLELDFRLNGAPWSTANGSPFAHDPIDHFLGREFNRTVTLTQRGLQTVEYRVRIGDDEAIVGWTFFVDEPAPPPPNCEDVAQLGLGQVCTDGVNRSAGTHTLYYLEEESHTTDCFGTRPGPTEGYTVDHEGSFRWTGDFAAVQANQPELNIWRGFGHLTCLSYAGRTVAWTATPVVSDVSQGYADALQDAIGEELETRADCGNFIIPICELSRHGNRGTMNESDVVPR